MGKRILLVEDTKSLAENIMDILQMEGYTVLLAEDGLQALSLLKTEAFDLILTDIVMPNMEGLDMIHEIRQQKKFKKTPIIILSAKATEETIRLGNRAGANLFLKKPCNTEFLLTSVQALLFA